MTGHRTGSPMKLCPHGSRVRSAPSPVDIRTPLELAQVHRGDGERGVVEGGLHVLYGGAGLAAEPGVGVPEGVDGRRSAPRPAFLGDQLELGPDELRETGSSAQGPGKTRAVGGQSGALTRATAPLRR